MAALRTAPQETDADGRAGAGAGTRRVGRRLALAVVVIVLLWGGALTWSLITARGELEGGRAEAVQGRRALMEGDAAAAAQAFARAGDHFDRADTLLSTPLVRPVGVLAVVHEDLRTVRGLARAGALIARAAEGPSAAVAHLPGGLRGLAPRDGRLPVERIAELAVPLQEADALLGEARAVLDATPAQRLAAPVLAARSELDEQLSQAEVLVGEAAAASEVLPAFLGGQGPRRYFFAASTPAELRGTGGYLGSYAILTIDDGRLDFGEFEALTDLPTGDLSAVQAPSAEFARRYNRHGGAAFWPNINFTPHLPAAATAIERLWEATRGEPLDGTIVADPFAFATLLEASGPVVVPGIGTVGADEVVEVVANEAYAAFDDEDQRKAVLGAVAAGALQGFLGGGLGAEGDTVGLLRSLAASAGEGHLQLHAARGQEQAVLERLGVAGAVPVSGDLVGVIANQSAASKVDYYVSRRWDVAVTLESDGAAVVDGRVSFRNAAPTSGLPKRVIGPGVEGLSAGDDQFFLTLYCGGPDCRLESFTPTTGGPEPRAEPELGRTAYSTGVVVRSGEEEQLAFRWRRDDAWGGDTSGGSYTLHLLDQTTIVPTEVAVEVRLPEGTEVWAAPEDAVVAGDTVTWSGEVARLHELQLTFGRPAPPPEPPSVIERVRRLLAEPILRFGMFIP